MVVKNNDVKKTTNTSESQRPIEEYSVAELKVAAYDIMANMEQMQRSLQIINRLIEKKQKQG